MSALTYISLSAAEFAKHGAAGLVLHYLGDDATELEILHLREQLESDTTRVVTVPGDIADPLTSQKIVDTAVSVFGRIDVLVSNAGICPFAEFLTMPIEVWSRTREVNLDGSFYVVQGFVVKSRTEQVY